MEGRVYVVVLRKLPFQGARRRGLLSAAVASEGPKELGEGFDLRPPVVQEPVVEDAEKPHLFLPFSSQASSHSFGGASGGEDK